MCFNCRDIHLPSLQGQILGSSYIKRLRAHAISSFFSLVVSCCSSCHVVSQLAKRDSCSLRFTTNGLDLLSSTNKVQPCVLAEIVQLIGWPIFGWSFCRNKRFLALTQSMALFYVRRDRSHCKSTKNYSMQSLQLRK